MAFGALCAMGLQPFMQSYLAVFLFMQVSTLVLDMYACGRLLIRRESKYLFLSVIHPLVFFIARVCVAIPLSYTSLKFLVDAWPRHDAHLATSFLCLAVLVNVFNLYWFVSMASASAVGSVLSVGRGGETMNVKWFAFNLNWFDVGVTLTFGNVQTSKLKITNSSYKYARPGLAIPLALVCVCLLIMALLNDEDLTTEQFVVDGARAGIFVITTAALENNVRQKEDFTSKFILNRGSNLIVKSSLCFN
jgi:hypothetical protein